ncbi:MAG: hypothetical protein H0W34_02255 [Pyrinomonadaceae bacterium]|nr:hypothetical protein [Pyrinomonadaceae bacterium]
MHTSRVVIAIVFMVLIGFSVHARAQATVTDLTGLAWMAGNWSGVQGGVEMEEFWQTPKGNTMLGLHRDVARGRTVSFEFLRIEATPEAIIYWASPRGRRPHPFVLLNRKRNALFSKTRSMTFLNESFTGSAMTARCMRRSKAP